jgi:C-terminal processing protease CtpA/Prc
VTLSSVPAGERNGGFPVVAAVEAGAPAGRAGVRRGDVLLAVEGVSGAVGPDVFAANLRGREGTRVGFVVGRGGEEIGMEATREKVGAERLPEPPCP